MAKIRQSNLDASVFTGNTELTTIPADDDILIIYDTSTGTIKKINRNKVIGAPSLSSVSPTNVLSGDGTGNATFTLTGTDFDGSATAVLLTSGGSEVSFDSVTRDSATQITGVIAISSLSNANEPYGVKVTNGNSTSSTLTGQINIDATPTFITASGSLGSDRFTMSSVSVNATDPESAGNVTFELQSGALPPGISITNTAAEGGTATFTGTISPLASSDTVYNFTLRAVDAASNTSSRAFSFTALGPVSESFTSSGTFSVPTGLSSADVLIVAGGGAGGGDVGGGGGAGGLIFFPSYPVTPSGTITVTVGCGGVGGGGCGTDGQDSVFGSPSDPGLGCGGVLTAKGGGASSGNSTLGNPGGSGAGPNGHQPGGAGGTGIQPTQPGNSGAYGFGNPGGSASPNVRRGGGGGGAGGAGVSASMCGPAGGGGVGKSYTIADGTTPVAYAGGGGGAVNIGCQPGPASPCGTGGAGSHPNAGGCFQGDPGTANRGGGGGGGMNNSPRCGGQGGKGVVIVRY